MPITAIAVEGQANGRTIPLTDKASLEVAGYRMRTPIVCCRISTMAKYRWHVLVKIRFGVSADATH